MRLDRTRGDVAINCAGRTRGIAGNIARPADMITANLKPAMQVFDMAQQMGVRRVVNFGSTCAYSPEVPTPFKPEDYLKGDPEPTNGAYAVAKRTIYVMSRAYADQCQMDNLYLVMPNLYGPGDHFTSDGHVIPSIIMKMDQAIKDGSPITLFGTGAAEREFLYVEDAAQMIMQATDNIYARRPVHISSGETITVKDLAALIAGLMGFRGEILWDATKPDGQLKRLLAKDIVPVQPTALEEGLKKTISWYRA